jgi:phage N-6-adenine-methyltransferase
MALVLKVANRVRGPGPADSQSTPLAFFNRLDREFKFTLDVAAEDAMHRCSNYFTASDDGLAQRWDTEGSVWCNPPYSNVWPWVRKAYKESKLGTTVVMLVMASTGSKWYKYAMKRAAEIRLVTGSLTFGPGTRRAPFGSAVFIFKGKRLSGGAKTTQMDRDEKTFTCDLCSERFVKGSDLSGHKRRIHNIRKRKYVAWDCDKCNVTIEPLEDVKVCLPCNFCLCPGCFEEDSHIHPLHSLC